MHKIIALLLFLVPLSGCFQQVSKPSEITLVEAMTQVGRGLAEMRAAQGDSKTGLIAESASVTFNISANSSVDSGLKLDLSSPAVSEGVIAGGKLDGKQGSARSNVVTVTFKNVLALPKDTVGFVLAGEEDNGKGTKLDRTIKQFNIELLRTVPKPNVPLL